jgi:hypothetical protein
MICPDCEGKKQVHAHLNYGNGRGEWKDIDCFRCKATGEVDDEQALWIVQGKQRRCDRVSRDMSLREEAVRLGIPVVDLSAMERGMKPFPTTGVEGGLDTHPTADKP